MELFDFDVFRFLGKFVNRARNIGDICALSVHLKKSCVCGLENVRQIIVCQTGGNLLRNGIAHQFKCFAFARAMSHYIHFQGVGDPKLAVFIKDDV
ncbi:MAG TPA: hypothetical protein VHD56_02950 [Tepidisphaeraceae bacterium]|nr:hypothetical protein [Tepidisphaeraceae bacterium]